MTGPEFRALRYKTGLSGLDWGRALGYSGQPESIRNQIRRFEGELRPRKIPPWIERLARMYVQYGIPEHYLPRR